MHVIPHITKKCKYLHMLMYTQLTSYPCTAVNAYTYTHLPHFYQTVYVHINQAHTDSDGLISSPWNSWSWQTCHQYQYFLMSCSGCSKSIGVIRGSFVDTLGGVQGFLVPLDGSRELPASLRILHFLCSWDGVRAHHFLSMVYSALPGTLLPINPLFIWKNAAWMCSPCGACSGPCNSQKGFASRMSQPLGH